MRNKQTTYRVHADMTPVAIAASTAPSAEVSSQVYVVRLHATVACHIAFDEDATANNMMLAAGATEYFAVSPGQTVNVIQNSTGGTLYITEMTS